MRPITAKINVSRIDKALLFKGEKGTYLNVAIFPNKNGKGQFGDTHFVAQEVTKEQREAGVKGPIIGSLTMPEETTSAPRPPSGGYRKPNIPPVTKGHENDDWDENPPF